MDRITFRRNDAVFSATFAAPSVLTGNFVACVTGETEEAVRAAFTEPGTIHVEDLDGLIPAADYDGYRSVKSIDEDPDGLLVIVTKEAPGDG